MNSIPPQKTSSLLSHEAKQSPDPLSSAGDTHAGFKALLRTDWALATCSCSVHGTLQSCQDQTPPWPPSRAPSKPLSFKTSLSPRTTHHFIFLSSLCHVTCLLPTVTSCHLPPSAHGTRPHHMALWSHFPPKVFNGFTFLGCSMLFIKSYSHETCEADEQESTFSCDG